MAAAAAAAAAAVDAAVCVHVAAAVSGERVEPCCAAWRPEQHPYWTCQQRAGAHSHSRSKVRGGRGRDRVGQGGGQGRRGSRDVFPVVLGPLMCSKAKEGEQGEGGRDAKGGGQYFPLSLDPLIAARCGAVGCSGGEIPLSKAWLVA